MVLDCFGLNPTQYFPFLLKNSSELMKNKVFIYHSHLQGQDMN